MSTNLQKLLEKKTALQQKLEAAMTKRCQEVTTLLKQTELLAWSNPALKALFQEAEKNTQAHYLTVAKASKNKRQPSKGTAQAKATPHQSTEKPAKE